MRGVELPTHINSCIVIFKTEMLLLVNIFIQFLMRRCFLIYAIPTIHSDLPFGNQVGATITIDLDKVSIIQVAHKEIISSD